MYGYASNLLCILSIIGAVNGIPTTVLLPRGKTQCFFQPAKAGSKFEVEVFVFHGGALDVGLAVSGTCYHHPLPSTRK